MAYLNLDLDYFNHPKVVRLVGLIGAEHIAIPIKLWCYVGKYHAHDGMLKGYSKQEIESAIGWTGPSTVLLDALVQIGFLEIKGDSYKVHDWKDHAGHLEAFKKRAKSGAKARWKKYASSNAKPRITTTPTLPLLSSPNLSAPTKPTKIEEEENTSTGSNPPLPDEPEGGEDQKPRPKEKGRGVETWEAYAAAFEARYKVPPVRNKTTNSHIAHFVDRLGAEAAPKVATFFLSHNKPLYVSARHATQLLLRDAEGLHTEWASGVKVTSREIQTAEQADNAKEQLARVQRIMAMKEPIHVN